MRIVFSIGVVAFLAACSSSSTPPGGSCEARASTELNALTAAIQTAETNIERGFSIERQISEDGLQVTDVEIRINAAKERQRLADMQARLVGVQASTDAALAQCG